MLQLNLLPDVKLEFIRAQQRKRTVISISAISAAIALAILVSLFLLVNVAQKQHMKAVDKDIDRSVAKLKETQDLDKILTVQNQLNSLPALHNDKMISSRLFGYLNQLTPNKATISDVTLDFDATTLNIKGNADALSTINKFADTLKFTTYSIEGVSTSGEPPKAFKEVVLKSFQVASEGTDTRRKISYELEMKFDVSIFANSAPSNEGKSPVTLTVPNIISTRSATGAPTSLYEPQPGGDE